MVFRLIQHTLETLSINFDHHRNHVLQHSKCACVAVCCFSWYFYVTYLVKSPLTILVRPNRDFTLVLVYKRCEFALVDRCTLSFLGITGEFAVYIICVPSLFGRTCSGGIFQNMIHRSHIVTTTIC